MDKLLDFFQNTQERTIRRIQQLVEIESPSRDEAGSRMVATWLTDETRKISENFKVERILVEGYGEHLIIRAFESLSGKPVLLLGHTDTVHPRGTREKNPTRIEDGRLYGCGSFDMKANIVLMLEVLRAFTELELAPKNPLTILLSCDEEIGSYSGREIVEREAQGAEFCLVCEPSAGGSVKTGRKGTGMFRIKTRGIPAHAGLEPEKGASAILEIARQIQIVHKLNNLAKGTTANACTITGGTTSNVIPAEAECEIDVRFTSMKEAERIENAIKNLTPFDERVTIEIEGEINRPPMERSRAVVKLYEKARRIAAGFDYELGETQVGGASDGNFVAALGVPLLDGLGVSGAGAHTLDEFIFIEDIPKRATLLAKLLLAE
ncbi:MAG TPA: M20 family metallopeptidase [Pyrinomonadaceae bacterium]|jgi:glutamate carboxypeptidase|nr:M20 family metallopeptidase [Pyrinomonadaceae bacterium]